MRLKLVRLLAVLVAFAVPLQGMASVMAAQCMASGHHDTPMSHADDGQGAHDGHDDHGQAPESKSPHCGPCAACCASASMAAPAVAFEAAAAKFEAPFRSASLPPARRAPDQPDRPPLAL